MKCGGYKYKGTKTQDNCKQGFISGEQLKNIWCDDYLKAWKQRNTEEEAGKGTKVRCTEYRRKNTVCEKEKRQILYPECKIEKKALWQNWRVATYPEKGKVQQDGA